MIFKPEKVRSSIPKNGPIAVGRDASEHFRNREDVFLAAQDQHRQAAVEPATAAAALVVNGGQRASELRLEY